MKTNLLKLLEDYKSGALYTEQPQGGKSADEQTLREKELMTKEKILVAELKARIKSNAGWLKFIYGLLTAIIILLSILLWRKQNDMEFFSLILGGQGFSIFVCIKLISYLYTQKRGSELLLFLYLAAANKKEREKILDEIIIFLKGRSNALAQ